MALLLNSCGSSKKVAYFQNIDEVSLAASRGLYDAKIMPKDLLTITVNTTDPAAAAPFNLVVRRSLGSDNQLSTSGGSLQGYLVDNDGDIDFPIVGKLHVVGLTKRQCENLIREKIIPYLSKTENPIITVRMSSYKVTVLGEVGRPGSFSVGTEKINILEALAQAGDLSIYGKRENLLLIREDPTGQKHQYRLNLNDANLIN
jgi:polysaccharide export outer membrane protein